MEDCIFCKIIKGEIPAHKIYEDEKALVFLEINPWSRGHSLIVPKKHFENIFDIDEESLKAVISAVQKTSSLLKERLGAAGVNVLQNNGEAAGQVVPHIHFQAIPRYKEGGLKMHHESDYKGDDLEKVVKILTDLR